MRVAVAAVALLAAGCAHTFAGTGPQEHVGVRAGPASGVQAALYDNGLYGPNVAVKRGPMFYRGQLMNRIVDLTWADGRVAGMVDSAPADLHWEPSGDGLRIFGLFGGKLSNLRVTSETIEGNLGGCGYHLEAGQRGYQGRALCLGGFEREAEVVLPADLASRPEGEQVALVAMLLSGGGGRSALELARTAEEAAPGMDYYWNAGALRESSQPAHWYRGQSGPAGQKDQEGQGGQK